MKKTNDSPQELPQQLTTNITPLKQEALSCQINSQEDLTNATVLLSNLNKYLDSIVEYKEKKTKPLNEALRVIRAETKPYEADIQSAIDFIRLKMSLFQTSLIKTKQEAEQAITARVGPGKGNLSVNTAIKKLEALPTVLKEIPTDAGLVQFREKKQLRITDLSLIPDIYWHIDDASILLDLKKGITIPGAEIEIIQVPVNYR